MTDDAAKRMWPTLRVGAAVDEPSNTLASKKDGTMHDTTADRPHHHRTVELAP